MSQYVAAIDQGTTSTRCILFDASGRIGRRRPGRAPADLPPRRLGGARPGGDLGQHPPGRRGGPGPRPTSPRATSPPWASPTSARPRWSGTGAPAAPCTTRSSGRTRAPRPSATGWPGSAAARAATATSPDSRWRRTSPPRRCAGSSTRSTARGRRRARRPAVRHDRHLAAVERHGRGGRRPAPHRRHQRLPDPADGSRHARLGTSRSREEIGVPVSMLPQIRSSSEVYGAARPAACWPACRWPGRWATSRRPPSGRSASRSAPARTPTAPATSCCSTPAPSGRSEHGLLTTVCYRIGDREPVYALEGSIAVTGSLVQWLRDNLGILASAAEVEPLARQRRRQRRRVRRAGVLRPLRAVLAARRRAARSSG